MIKVCFVCLGNICRSPTAEGIFRAMVTSAGRDDEFSIDSAGTSGWHVGASPDERSSIAAARRGYSIEGASRQFIVDDFDRFDHVIAMDHENVADLRRIARNDADRSKISLLRSFDDDASGEEVPDPYYGGGDGFERVLDVCEDGCSGLLRALTEGTHHG